MTDLRAFAQPGTLAVEAGGLPVCPDDAASTAGEAASWMTLFNQDRFHDLNLREGQRVLRAEAHDQNGRLVGVFGGILDGDVFTCGQSAPFGGVDFVRERETPASVALVVDRGLEQIRASGVRTLRVKLPPPCYGEIEPLVAFTLLNRGFCLERCELNQHIDLGMFASPDSYVESLRSPARRALLKLLGEDFSFVVAETEADWDEAYDLLAANRAAKGRKLALSRSYLARAWASLGETVRMHLMRHDDLLVAAALVYRVRPRRDLVVAWGDGEHGLERSPMNLLAYRIVENALAERVLTLDLGVSNEHGSDGQLEPNCGLVQFKQSLLARSQTRLTLVRELTP